MTTPTAHDPLLRYIGDLPPRPMPAALRDARRDVVAAVGALRAIPDASLTRPWAWKGGSEEELRYGFYRIGEAFELAAIDAGAATRGTGADRGRAADLIAQATTARWELQGLVIPLASATWDADPGGGEWTIRQTLGHVIASQRGYGVGTAWWQANPHRADDPGLPSAPEAIYDELPSEDAEAEGSPADVRDRLDAVLDLTTERMAGLPEERLALAARWSGFAVTVGFRFGRMSSHIREHTIQVEKTLVMLNHRPAEVDRLLRHVLAAWGRAEAVVYAMAEPVDAMGILSSAAADARAVAAEIAELAGD